MRNNKRFVDFRCNQSGAVAPIVGMLAVVLIAAAGVALDTGRALSVEAALVRAADAAAMAGAVASEKSRIEAATAIFAANYTGTAKPIVEVAGASVKVRASEVVPTTLSVVLGVKDIPVSVVSEAIIGATSPAPQCILLLEPDDIGLYANSDAKLDANCGLQVNSGHSAEAVFANSGSHIKAASIRVHGTSRTNSGSTIMPSPVDGSAPQSDPLESLAEPPAGSCTFTGFSVDSGQSRTMSPGVYCNTTSINSGATATMQPGVYVFRDGEFLINSLSTVTGSGVMMYFQNDTTRLNVNSDSVFKVSAPTSGTYAGMLIFQGRHPNNSGAPPFIVNSNGTTKLEGTIYLPLGTLELNSDSTANQTAAYTAIVAGKLVLNSFGTMTVKSDFNGATPLPPLLAGFKNVTLARLTK